MTSWFGARTRGAASSGSGGQFTGPGLNMPTGGQDQGPPGDLPSMIQQLVAALGMSAMQTNHQINNLAQAMHFSSDNLNQNFGFLAQQMQYGGSTRDGSGSAGGYGTLKPKKDMTKITAENARGLMVELDQFEIDLGEIGAPMRSEEAYRQLRAMADGNARDVLNLEIEYGAGKALKMQLDAAVAAGAAKTVKDEIGGRLFNLCIQKLEDSVHLTRQKRIEIAQLVDKEAVMHGDGPKEAEQLLRRIRKSRRLLLKEGLMRAPTHEVLNFMQQQGATGEVLHFVTQMLKTTKMKKKCWNL